MRALLFRRIALNFWLSGPQKANWFRNPENRAFEMTNSAFHILDDANCATAEASFEFDQRRVPLLQRMLLTDGVPIELGARAFELLLTLLEAEDRWSERSAFPHPVE